MTPVPSPALSVEVEWEQTLLAVLSAKLSVEVEWEQTLLAVPSANCGSIRSAVVSRAD